MIRKERLTSSRSAAVMRHGRWQSLLSLLLVAMVALCVLPIRDLRAIEPETTPAGNEQVVAGSSETSEDVDFNSKGVGQMEMELPALDKVQCASYFCYDRTAKQVLLAKDENKKIYPASMTKIMTLALAMEYLDPMEKITVSKTAMDATTPNSTMMGVVVGEEIEANELYFGLMLPSGNDAANVLAEEIAKHYNAAKGALPTTTPAPTTDGSAPKTEDPNTFSLIGQFAYISNMKVRALGLTNTHFVNPNGLQNENHYTTAHDLSMIFDYALNFEDFCTVIHSPTHFFKADNKHPFDGWKVVKNTNNLLTDPWMLGEDSHCAEVYGGKTGTTKAAGTGMTLLTINENGHEIITCVCGIPYDLADRQTVYVATVVREANIRCWESDPTHRIDGNVIDNRAYNAPDAMGPSGTRADVTVSGQESDATTESMEPSETTLAPTTDATVVTPEPQAEKKNFMEKHPVLVIVLVVLATIVVGLIVLTTVSVARAKRRRKRMGVRKVRF